jgi:hypothetical protein
VRVNGDSFNSVVDCIFRVNTVFVGRMTLGGDMRRTKTAALMGLFITGCGDKKDDTGTSDGGGNAGGGCELFEETPLELDATTPGGVNVTDMVNILTGTHEADLTWADDTTTVITATITDVTNARWQDYEVVAGPSGATIEIECGDFVAVDLQLSLVTADGQLDESMAHTARQTEGVVSPVLLVELTDTSGTFDAAAWSDGTYDDVWSTLSASWTENGIEGVIDGFGEATSGEIVSMSRFDVATFAAGGY